MQPLQHLLHRIQWDAGFGTGEFTLGYLDRISRQETVVPFTAVRLDPGSHGFTLVDASGDVAHIPLHRVRTVYKDGVVIWRRPRHPADT